MKNVVFVAPHFLENTLRYVQALADLDGTRVGLISCDPVTKLPPRFREGVEAHYRVADCLDPAQLAKACRGLAHGMGAIDRLLGPLEQMQLPLAHAREACGIPGMGVATATAFRDKTRMKDLFQRAGVPCARHRRIESAADAYAFVTEVGLPIILKPIDGLGSRGTQRIRTSAELDAALKSLSPSPSRPIQAEEFIRGIERTCETVTITTRGSRQSIWHSGTHYLPGPLEVIENPWIQYCVLLPREDDADFRAFTPLNVAALDALGMETGLSHMEWFVRRDGTHAVSEVGARPPGVQIMPLMSIAHGVDMVDEWCRLQVHGQFSRPARRLAAGVAFFRGQGQGKRVTAVRGVAEANDGVGPLVVDKKLPTVGQPATSGYEGEGWAIVAHERTEVVRQALSHMVSHVRVELG
ncbi:MAG: ATP-grasp domain-containing protein [Myxococcales bacterium]|nr:ATP-grasp domain-containing protein [Myxococcales bacterium]